MAAFLRAELALVGERDLDEFVIRCELSGRAIGIVPSRLVFL